MKNIIPIKSASGNKVIFQLYLLILKGLSWFWIGCGLFIPLPVLAVEIVLVYTGNTRSLLDVCGCSDQQIGGLPRRATAIKEIQEVYPNALILNVGGLFYGDSGLDRLRCSLHMKAMTQMEYDFANLGIGEFRFGQSFFQSESNRSGLNFVSANLVMADSSQRLVSPFYILDRGGIKIGVTGITGEIIQKESKTGRGFVIQPSSLALAAVLNSLKKKADFVVVLSDLFPEENHQLVNEIPELRLILNSRSEILSEYVKETLILGTVPPGKAVGLAVLEIEEGRIKTQHVERVFLSEEISENQEMARLVQGFYDSVGSNSEFLKTAKPTEWKKTVRVTETKNNDRVKVELFVMPHCPYGIQAEEALIPVIEGLGDKIDFSLHFIADEVGKKRKQLSKQVIESGSQTCEGKVLNGIGRFRSLHGDAEVREGIQQAVIMKLYPDRYFSYILCRNKNITSGNWKHCADIVRIDPDYLASVLFGPQADSIFSKNIRRANTLGINASPTLLINGEEVIGFLESDVLVKRIGN